MVRSLFDRPLLRQPATRALLLLTTLLSLYAIYGSLYFYRDPLSIFFSEQHGFDQYYSAIRQAQADEFIDAAKASPDAAHSRLGKAGSEPQICAVFITVGRDVEGRQYIDSAVGSFLANMSRAERESIHLKIFFADVPNPALQHMSYTSLVETDIADDVLTYKSMHADQNKEANMETLIKWAGQRQNKHALEKKTVHDYAYAMKSCVQTTNAPYIAILEGDILLAEGWAARTLKDLQMVEYMMEDPMRHDPEPHRVEPGRPNSWLYLRLFNQERSTGWGGGTGFLSNKVHIISPAVGVPLLVLLLLVRRVLLPRNIARHVDGWVLFLVCGVAVPLFVWLFYASGKASLLGAPTGLREEFFGCCNQALVYNRAHTTGLADFMMDATARATPGRSDMLPKDYAWNHGLSRISAYPMMAQHAGRVSAIDTSSDEAKRVWSMAFEDLRPSKLYHDHVSDVRELFGDDAVKEMIDQGSSG